jgi:hypothetical protein
MKGIPRYSTDKERVSPSAGFSSLAQSELVVHLLIGRSAIGEPLKVRPQWGQRLIIVMTHIRPQQAVRHR